MRIYYYFLNLYPNVQLVKRDIVTAVIYYYITTKFHYVKLVQKKKKKTKERYKDENRKLLCRYAYKVEESKAYMLVINGHGLHTS